MTVAYEGIVETEIQKVDPRARKKAMIMLAILVVAGCTLILALDRYSEALREWLSENPSDALWRYKITFVVLMVAMSAPLFVLAAYFWNFASKIRRSKRFPPPNTPVLKDTRVVTDHSALVHARLWGSFAVALTLLAMLIPVLFWWIIRMIEEGAA